MPEVPMKLGTFPHVFRQWSFKLELPIHARGYLGQAIISALEDVGNRKDPEDEHVLWVTRCKAYIVNNRDSMRARRFMFCGVSVIPLYPRILKCGGDAAQCEERMSTCIPGEYATQILLHPLHRESYYTAIRITAYHEYVNGKIFSIANNPAHPGFRVCLPAFKTIVADFLGRLPSHQIKPRQPWDR